MKFEERRPVHGETCRIIWASWYAKKIGVESTLAVYDQFKGGDRMAFFDGNQWIFLWGYPTIEVLVKD